MGTASFIAKRGWWLPVVVATTLTLAGCGQTPAGPGASLTTLPGASTTSQSPTSSASPTSASGTSTASTSSTPATTSASGPTSDPATTTNAKPGEPTPAEAIRVWMERKGYVYAGECATTTVEDDLGKYCSSLCEDRGSSQIHKIGPTFSEYTTWLLLARTDGTWRVIDTARDTGTAPAPW